MNETRLEEDLLGKREVPKDSYYGIQTIRAVENFPITGQRIHPKLIKALAMVKKAAAFANMYIGILNPRIGNAIVQAASEIIAGKLLNQFIVDVIQGGAGTSINMNMNEVLANRAIEILGGEKGDYAIVHPNTHVNMSQSTNDVFPTAVKIACFQLTELLLIQLQAFEKELKKKEKEFDHIIKIGRTHLQDAVPVRVGQEFGAYARLMKRDFQRIKRAGDSLLEINLGATAIGTGLNANPNYIHEAVKKIREISGLNLKLSGNLIDTTQNTDTYVELSNALKLLALNLSKLANDIRLISSGPTAGLNEINLPAVQPGSSIMPGKVNPVIPEVINQIAFQVMGNDLTIAKASEAGQLELNVMEPVLVYNLIQSIQILKKGLKIFNMKCIQGIEVNEEHCQEMVENSISLITAITPHVGYEIASDIAKEAIKTGESIRKLAMQKGALQENDLNIILNPFEMTNPGIAGYQILADRNLQN